MKKALIIINLIILLLIVAGPVFAVKINNPNTDYFVNIGDNSFKGIILFVIEKILLPIVGIISILFIIIGGFQFITSHGNEEQAEAGKKTLTNAIIGLVIVILSYIIVAVIINALNGSI